MERAAEIVRQEEEQKAREAAAAAEVTVQQPPREEAEEALPIGAHLDILDSDLPFEQQISRLAQPLSEGANPPDQRRSRAGGRSSPDGRTFFRYTVGERG